MYFRLKTNKIMTLHIPFKEWFAKIEEENKLVDEFSRMYKTHYPYIKYGYSDLLEDSEWTLRTILNK